MTFVFSLIVYGLLIFIMMYNANRVLVRRFIPNNFSSFLLDRNYLIPILFFCLVSCIRWRVGVDCNSYMAQFYDYDEQWLIGKGESGYLFLIRFFRFFHASHVPFFFVLAYLQIVFIYYTFKNVQYVLLFFPLFLVLTGEFWVWMNGVRQVISCCIFVYVTYQVSLKKWWLSIIMILIATLFHKSAFVLLPLSLIFCIPRIYISNKYFQIFLVGLSFMFMGTSITSHLSEVIENVMNMIGYGDSQEHMTETIIEKNFGFRSILLLASNMIVIWNSPKLAMYYKSNHFNIMYNLYFFGVCLSLVFYGNHGIERFLMYFRCFTPVILSYCAYYFYKHKSDMSKLLAFVAIISLLTIRTLYEFYDAGNRPAEECTLYKTIFFHNVPKGTYNLELW